MGKPKTSAELPEYYSGTDIRRLYSTRYNTDGTVRLLSWQTIHRWRKLGQLPCVKFGPVWRYPRREIEEALKIRRDPVTHDVVVDVRTAREIKAAREIAMTTHQLRKNGVLGLTEKERDLDRKEASLREERRRLNEERRLKGTL